MRLDAYYSGFGGLGGGSRKGGTKQMILWLGFILCDQNLLQSRRVAMIILGKEGRRFRGDHLFGFVRSTSSLANHKQKYGAYRNQ